MKSLQLIALVHTYRGQYLDDGANTDGQLKNSTYPEMGTHKPRIRVKALSRQLHSPISIIAP
ncbi:hypothetical protein D3C80_564570 [compost metagenome]